MSDEERARHMRFLREKVKMLRRQLSSTMRELCHTAGICSRCQKRSSTGGHTTCQECRDKYAKAWKEKHAKN